MLYWFIVYVIILYGKKYLFFSGSVYGIRNKYSYARIYFYFCFQIIKQKTFFIPAGDLIQNIFIRSF